MRPGTEKPTRTETLKGVLDRIRFQSENGEFAVCDLDATGRTHTVTIVGNIMSAHPGETVEVTGRWKNDPKFGRQFQIDSLRPVPPTTREGIEKYLSSGFVDGIGPVLGRKIASRTNSATRNPEIHVIDDIYTRPECSRQH